MNAALKVMGPLLLAALTLKPPALSGRAQKGSSPAPGRHTFKLQSGGRERTYHVQVPSGRDPSKRLPAVLVFHGAGAGGAQYLARNGWAAKAEAEGFLAVAPEGLPARPGLPPQFWANPRLWNDGQLRPEAARTKVDDVAFVEDLLTDLDRRFQVDPSRVFLAGHSNGAGMAFALAARLADRFAGLAVVAGHCSNPNPRPSRPLPTLYIIGTKDPLVTIEGGEVQLPWGKKVQPSVRQTLERWARAIGATGKPAVVREGGGLKVVRYGRGEGPASLTVVYIEGHGHGWPGGGDPGLLERWIGPSLGTFHATDAIWEFFSSIRAPGASGRSSRPARPRL